MSNSRETRNVIALASLGGMLDFYDFVIFGVFSPYLSRHFFPASDELVSLMKTFGVFAAGYLVRPLGGVVLSHIGDRLGRKRSLLISMLLMSLSTFLMGALPDYEHWGVAAPLLFIFLRLVQGFSLGGEIPGAITFATEALPERRGLVCGLIFFCINMGLLGGSAVHEAMIHFFSKEEIGLWAWRIPFFAGGAFGMVSYLLRLRLQETRAFAEITEAQPRIPLLELLREYPRALIGGCLVTALGATLIALCFIYMPIYLSEILHRDLRESVRAVNVSLFVFSFLIAIVGWASDHRNRVGIYLGGAILLALASWPLFTLLAPGGPSVLLVMLSLAVVGSFVTGTFPSILSEIFPARVRFSGIALAYNLPYAVFGGMAPLVATSLVRYSGQTIAPFGYLLASSFLGMGGAILLLRRTHGFVSPPGP
jgi:MFS transporter, MHS family, proline/betaine transporter